MSIPRFILFSFLITAFLVLTGYIVSAFWLPQISFLAVFCGITLSFFTGALAYMITYTGLQKPVKSFISYLIMGMFTKMLVGILIVILVAVVYQPVVKEYVTAYFISYFILTAFEVYGLMCNLRA